jgi:hypothetical protein
MPYVLDMNNAVHTMEFIRRIKLYYAIKDEDAVNPITRRTNSIYKSLSFDGIMELASTNRWFEFLRITQKMTSTRLQVWSDANRDFVPTWIQIGEDIADTAGTPYTVMQDRIIDNQRDQATERRKKVNNLRAKEIAFGEALALAQIETPPVVGSPKLID